MTSALFILVSFGFISALLLGTFASDDYYEILGLERSADNRELRRAYKKLAMINHPDKNKDDPDAHDKFVKINRAYEVLKDEELRKKYDQFGEEGLKDDFHGGQNFRSWQFFQNFGIYDEDPEITTLGSVDFEQFVKNSGDLWFVNYYSPACSHCHHLAPAWRELAKEFEGAVNVGAVNCEEEFMLCQSEGIRSYPSLVLYPSGQRYQGQREKSDLMEFLLSKVEATVLKLTETNFDAFLNDWEPYKDRPWLVDFCDDSDSCFSSMSRKKLSVMLDQLVNVGTIDCHENQGLCRKIGMDTGVAYFPKGDISRQSAKIFESLDPKEVSALVLKELPDVEEMDGKSLEDVIVGMMENQDHSWLMQFVDSKSTIDLELRKLPVMLDNTKIGRLNCSKHTDVCSNLYIQKTPAFVLFKPSGGYEMHHGRHAVRDVASFARDCAETTVRVLGPDDFPDTVFHDENPWFVDFFAPWCPPCMKLLPEFRKAAKYLEGDVNFGTVDCSVHQNLCQSMGVHSYPTSIFYYKGKPNNFVGLHSTAEILTFAEDVRNPPVIALTPETFAELVDGRSKDEVFLVDFFAPWCGPCQELAPEWRSLAKMLIDVKGVAGVGHVDCVEFGDLCRMKGIHSYPTIRIYPLQNQRSVDYNEWFRNAPSIRQWAQHFLPTSVVTLTANDFYDKVLNGDEVWLVDFYAPWCGPCQMFAPLFEQIAQKLEGRGVKAGKVDCDRYHSACQAAGIRAYPSVRFYADPPINGESRNSHGMEIQSQDPGAILQIVEANLPSPPEIQRGRSDDEL